MVFLFWSACVLFLLRIWLSLYGGVHPDEAYYWTWAQNLRLGYYDHPPLTAYIIRLGQEAFEFLLGSDYSGSKAKLIFSFRWLPSALGYIVFPCLIAGCIEEIQRRKISMSQIFALLSIPLVLFGAQIITPDLPLLLVWTGAFWVSLKMKRKLRHGFIAGVRTPFSWKFSLAMGALWALGAYSKYTAVFLPLLFILSGSGFWNFIAAGVIASTLSSPYLYWTLTEAYTHKMGVFYQLERGTDIQNTKIRLNWAGDMWAAQLLFWGPALCIDYLLSFRTQRKVSWSIGAWIFLPLIFFTITGLRNRPEANWPIMGGIALIALVLARHARHPIRLFWFTCFNYLTIILVLWGALNQNTVGKLIAPYYPELGHKLESKVSRIEEFRGWENLRNLVFEATLIDSDPIQVEKYHVLSPLLFYDKVAPKEEKLKERLKINFIPKQSVSQFHFEEEFLPKNDSSYWLLKKGDGPPQDINSRCLLKQSFTKADPRGEPFSLFKCDKP